MKKKEHSLWFIIYSGIFFHAVIKNLYNSTVSTNIVDTKVKGLTYTEIRKIN